MRRSNRWARGDPSTGGSSRPPVLLVLFLLLLLILSTHASAQWPPWLKKEPTKPVVYPEILVDAAAFEERAAEEEARIVDARSVASFVEGHIRGALSLPADSIVFGPDLIVRLNRRGLPTPRPVRVYGGGDPAEAAVVWWGLSVGGQEPIRLLGGGLGAWKGEFGKFHGEERGKPSFEGGEPSTFFDTTLVAPVDWVSDRYGTRGVEILDVRDSTAWRAGHVPHALPFDPRVVASSDGSFMSGEEIRAILARLGPRPSTVVDLESEFVVYDEGDAREAALAALVLRLGGVERVRLFPDGWRSWIANADRPIVKIVGAAEVAARLGPDLSAPPDDVLFFDVRNVRDHSIRRIPGSVCVQSDWFNDSLDTIVKRLRPGADRKNLTVILYCYGDDCIRSRECATWAARAGFRDLWWFLGGLPEWMGSGRETATDR